HREAVVGQRLQVVELLELAVAALAPGLVALPDDRRVAVALEALQRVAERRVPAPAVGADDPHALLHEVQRGVAPQSAAAVDVVLLAEPRPRARRADDDVQRLQLMADALELTVDVVL